MESHNAASERNKRKNDDEMGAEVWKMWREKKNIREYMKS